jgi:hypothetical protein
MWRKSGVLILLLTVAVAAAQTVRQRLTLAIQGFTGEVPVIQSQGRLLVDVQDVARLTNGSISFETDRVVLTLPCCSAPKPADAKAENMRFSHAFTSAAIEAMASIREWGGMLMITVQNGYPLGNTMAGNAIVAYQGRASDNVALASAAASTEADSRGLELLRSEFSNVQVWSDRYIKARNSLSSANLSTSPNALNDDQEVQKLIHCGQFLAQMFATSGIQDDLECR